MGSVSRIYASIQPTHSTLISFARSREVRLDRGGRRWFGLSKTLHLEPSPAKSEEAGTDPLLGCKRQWYCYTPPPVYPEGLAKPRVIIVGAGLAGLAAGWWLSKAGLTDIVILEALGRAGGRVHSCPVGGWKADLGGGELYNPTISNPLYNISVQYQMVTHDLERRVSGGPYYRPDGCVVSDVEEPIALFKAAVDDALRAPLAGPGAVVPSFKALLQEKINQQLENVSDSSRMEDILSVISGLENECRVRWGDDLSQISPVHLRLCRDRFLPTLMLSTIGASRLLEPFICCVGEAIKYCKAVQRIRWDPERTSRRECCGALCCDGEVFNGDFLICTVSLGVLKSMGATLFSPALPRDKLDSIARLGFGTINKIFLEYQRPFWAPSDGLLKIGRRPGDRDDSESWTRGIGSVEEVSPGMMKVTVAGKEAVWSESCSDQVIAEELTSFLRQVTGNPVIPCPSSIIRSKWGSDIYFLGSQSYLGLCSTPEDQICLRTPLPSPEQPIVMFAGEAVCTGHQGTMQGAVHSGIEQAERVIAAAIRKFSKEQEKEKEDPCIEQFPERLQRW